MKIFKKMKKGFTLVELVVVIAVIAILAAVSVGAYFGVTESANNSKLEQEAKQVYTAIQTVALTPNEIASLNKEGLKIEEANISTFETELEKNLGTDITVTTGTVSTVTGVVVNLSTSAYSVSPAVGTPVVYKTFEYYNSEVGGKKAVADVVTGDCKVIASTAENIPTQDPSESEPSETPTEDPVDPTPTEGWHLVENTNSLNADDQVIIVGTDEESTYAMSTNNRGNNRGALPVTIDNSVAVLSDHFALFTVGIAEGTYNFKTSAGNYLESGTSTEKNYLLEDEELSDNGKWTISINEGIASILSGGEGSRHTMQFNPNNGDPIFAYYGSANQKPVSIYKNYGPVATETVPQVSHIQFDSKFNASNYGIITELNKQKDLPVIQIAYNNGHFTNALNEDIIWSSSDDSVISFNEGKFEVISYAEKTITISAKHKDLDNLISFEVNVNVKEVVAGQDITYSHTFTSSKEFSYNNPTDLNGLTWEAISPDSTFVGYEGGTNGRGFQFGSSGDPCNSLTLSTTDLAGKTIKSVVINTSGASSVNATFELKIDTKSIGSNKISATTTDYEFESIDTICNESLAFVYTQTSSKALYIKSITIVYC